MTKIEKNVGNIGTDFKVFFLSMYISENNFRIFVQKTEHLDSSFRSDTNKKKTTEIRKNVGNIATDIKITNGGVQAWKNDTTTTNTTSENSTDSVKQNVNARKKKRCRPSKCKFYKDTFYKS